MQSLLFYVFSAALLFSSIFCVLSKSMVHSVLMLVYSFVVSSALFLLVGADYMSLIIMIIYVGAILVLFIFVVMMIGDKVQISEYLNKKLVFLSILIAFGFASILCIGFKNEVYIRSKGFGFGAHQSVYGVAQNENSREIGDVREGAREGARKGVNSLESVKLREGVDSRDEKLRGKKLGDERLEEVENLREIGNAVVSAKDVERFVNANSSITKSSESGKIFIAKSSANAENVKNRESVEDGNAMNGGCKNGCVVQNGVKDGDVENGDVVGDVVVDVDGSRDFESGDVMKISGDNYDVANVGVGNVDENVGENISENADENIAEDAEYSDTKKMAEIIFTKYIPHFEFAGLILLIAMIGAIKLAFRPVHGKRQNIFKQLKRNKGNSVEMVDVDLSDGGCVGAVAAVAASDGNAEGVIGASQRGGVSTHAASDGNGEGAVASSRVGDVRAVAAVAASDGNAEGVIGASQRGGVSTHAASDGDAEVAITSSDEENK